MKALERLLEISKRLVDGMAIISINKMSQDDRKIMGRLRVLVNEFNNIMEVSISMRGSPDKDKERAYKKIR